MSVAISESLPNLPCLAFGFFEIINAKHGTRGQNVLFSANLRSLKVNFSLTAGNRFVELLLEYDNIFSFPKILKESISQDMGTKVVL